jgi:creatinine amidohydrolase
MRLSEVAWTDVRDADVDVAFLPVGSTEQHGPHAPLEAAADEWTELPR